MVTVLKGKQYFKFVKAKFLILQTQECVACRSVPLAFPVI